MPIDKQALAEFIGGVRKDESAYKASGERARRMQRVIAASGEGTPQRMDLASAITGMRAVGEHPDANKLMGTRTADMFRGLISEEEVHDALNGEGGLDAGLQKIAALLYQRLGKLGVSEQFRGEFLGDVMNRFEAGLAGRK